MSQKKKGMFVLKNPSGAPLRGVLTCASLIFIIILLVNTCCLIPNNSKWPLSSLFNFVCLTYVYFWVPWVPLWYPKIIVLKSMMSRLSNAVSDTFFGFPSAFLQWYEVWSFLWIFRRKFTFWDVPWNWIKSWMFQILCVLIQKSYEDDRHGVGELRCFTLGW